MRLDVASGATATTLTDRDGIALELVERAGRRDRRARARLIRPIRRKSGPGPPSALRRISQQQRRRGAALR